MWGDEKAALDIFRQHGVIPSEGDIKCDGQHCDNNVMKPLVDHGQHKFSIGKRYTVRAHQNVNRLRCQNRVSMFKGTLLEKYQCLCSLLWEETSPTDLSSTIKPGPPWGHKSFQKRKLRQTKNKKAVFGATAKTCIKNLFNK